MALSVKCSTAILQYMRLHGTASVEHFKNSSLPSRMSTPSTM